MSGKCQQRLYLLSLWGQDRSPVNLFNSYQVTSVETTELYLKSQNGDFMLSVFFFKWWSRFWDTSINQENKFVWFSGTPGEGLNMVEAVIGLIHVKHESTAAYWGCDDWRNTGFYMFNPPLSSSRWWSDQAVSGGMLQNMVLTGLENITRPLKLWCKHSWWQKKKKYKWINAVYHYIRLKG